MLFVLPLCLLYLDLLIQKFQNLIPQWTNWRNSRKMKTSHKISVIFWLSCVFWSKNDISFVYFIIALINNYHVAESIAMAWVHFIFFLDLLLAWIYQLLWSSRDKPILYTRNWCSLRPGMAHKNHHGSLRFFIPFLDSLVVLIPSYDVIQCTGLAECSKATRKKGAFTLPLGVELPTHFDFRWLKINFSHVWVDTFLRHLFQ